jgi:hypothetical protein
MSGVVMVVAMVLYAYEIDSMWYLYGVSLLGGISNAAIPAIKAMVPDSVKGEQGVAMGTLSLVQALVQLVPVPVVGAIYKATSSTYRPTTFLVLAGAAGVYLVLGLCMRAKQTEALPVVGGAVAGAVCPSISISIGSSGSGCASGASDAGDEKHPSTLM